MENCYVQCPTIRPKCPTYNINSPIIKTHKLGGNIAYGTIGALELRRVIGAIIVFFWIMKICATTLGETAGNLLSMTTNVGYAITFRKTR